MLKNNIEIDVKVKYWEVRKANRMRKIDKTIEYYNVNAEQFV